MTDQAWKTVLRRYGQPVLVYAPGAEEGTSARAFLQPLLRQGEDQQVPSPLGLRREDQFLYLGPAHVPVQEGGQVECQGTRYLVQAAHLIAPGPGGHFWAVLRPRDKEENP